MVPSEMEKRYHHFLHGKNAIFLKKRYWKDFIEAGLVIAKPDPSQNHWETYSTSSNHLAVIWMHSVWEANFSKLFFDFSEWRFGFFLKKCVSKLFLLFQNSNWNIVKSCKNWKIWVSSKRSDLNHFLQFWPCSHGNFEKIM